MQTEIEAKWLNIDISEMRRRLKAIGAILVTPERLMVRSVFDYPDKRLEKISGWIRVRDEGDKITLSYKQLHDRTLHGTQEVSVVVDDYENTRSLLESIGLRQYSAQETKRESWRLGNVEIELDTWPWIPSFIEIEADNESNLFEVAESLKLDRKAALYGSVEVAYQAVYDVSEEEIDNWEEIRFIDTPDWLSQKAKNSQSQPQ